MDRIETPASIVAPEDITKIIENMQWYWSAQPDNVPEIDEPLAQALHQEFFNQFFDTYEKHLEKIGHNLEIITSNTFEQSSISNQNLKRKTRHGALRGWLLGLARKYVVGRFEGQPQSVYSPITHPLLGFLGNVVENIEDSPEIQESRFMLALKSRINDIANERYRVIFLNPLDEYSQRILPVMNFLHIPHDRVEVEVNHQRLVTGNPLHADSTYRFNDLKFKNNWAPKMAIIARNESQGVFSFPNTINRRNIRDFVYPPL